MAADRSTKRQKELLDYVDRFIKEHGYGPSYREVMNALGYKSVSTVAVHINGLISKGYLHKRDNSARSLEVVSTQYSASAAAAPVAKSGTTAAREKWLVEAVNDRFGAYTRQKSPDTLDELYVLIGALKVLGFEEAYVAMRDKLGNLTQ